MYLCLEYDSLAKVIAKHPNRKETTKYVIEVKRKFLGFFFRLLYTYCDFIRPKRFVLDIRCSNAIKFRTFVLLFTCRQIESLDKELQSMKETQETLATKVCPKLKKLKHKSFLVYMCFPYWRIDKPYVSLF